MCDSLQALAGEGCALMWGLVDLNPTVLASFVNCDLEAAAPRQNLSSDMWTSILVSPGPPLQKPIDIKPPFTTSSTQDAICVLVDCGGGMPSSCCLMESHEQITVQSSSSGAILAD